jgi:phosphate transport system substrate-binding protein
MQTQIAEGDLPLAAIAGPPSEDLWSAPVAADALAVIVHPDNPLASLTLAQLHQVFSGRTWRWSELGVQGLVGAEIVVVSREQGSGTRAAFEDLALRERPEQEPRSVTTMAVLRFSSAKVVAYVAEHPAAIGYVALGALDAGAAVRVIAVEDVAPSAEQVAGGAYPLSLPLFIVARQEPTGAARQFLDFCLSPAGQAIVAQGYVRVRE